MTKKMKKANVIFQLVLWVLILAIFFGIVLSRVTFLRANAKPKNKTRQEYSIELPQAICAVRG